MKSTIEIKVRGYHEDHFKHVNNARYLEFLEEGRWTYYEENDLIENLFHKKGIYHAVVGMNIKYRNAASAGDILRVDTEVGMYSKSQMVMLQNIYKKSTNKLILSAEVTNIFIDSVTQKIKPVDDEVLSLWQDLQNLPLQR